MYDIFFSLGDLSAANYVVEILKHLKEKNLSISGITDDRMEFLGVKSIGSIKDINVVGIAEVLPKIFYIKNTLDKAVYHANNSKLVVLCDAPGFNFRLMKKIEHKNIVYFISPQVWAWKWKRIYEIVKYVRHLIVIFPFEVPIYRPLENEHFKVHYFGHPILDIVKASTNKKEPFVAMLPGSRASEFKRHIDLLEKLSYYIYNKYHLKSLIPIARTLDLKPTSYPHLKLTKESSLDVMSRAYFGVIASGTASLEAAVLELPHIIFYRLNPISLIIGRMLVKTKYIGLPNIIMDKNIIPELIQPSFEQLRDCADIYLQDEKKISNMKNDLSILKEKLGPEGASKSIANFLIKLLEHY